MALLSGPLASLGSHSALAIAFLVTNVVAARALTTEEFGAFGIGLAVSQVAIGLTQAGLSTPISSVLHEVEAKRAQRALSALSLLVNWTAVVAIIAAMGSLLFKNPALSMVAGTACLSIGRSAFLIKKSLCYDALCPDRAVIGGMTFIPLVITSLGTATILGYNRPGTFLSCIGLAFALACLLSRPRVNPAADAPPADLWQLLKLSARHGGWLLSSMGISSINRQSILLIAAALTDLTTVAGLTAARTVANGILVFMNGLRSFYRPRMRRLFLDDNLDGMIHNRNAFLSQSGLFLLPAAIIVLAFPDWSISALFGSDYQQFGWIIQWATALTLARAFFVANAVTSFSIGRNSIQFASTCAGTILSLTLVWPLTIFYNASGVMLTYTILELTIILTSYLLLGRALKERGLAIDHHRTTNPAEVTRRNGTAEHTVDNP